MKPEKTYFEKIYEELFIETISELYSKLPPNFKTYPNAEMQRTIIERHKNAMDCAFRFTDNVRADLLEPVYDNDPFFLRLIKKQITSGFLI